MICTDVWCVCSQKLHHICSISKCKLLCVHFFIPEEEADTKKSKREGWRKRERESGGRGFLGPFKANDKIPQGRRVPSTPTALFASSLSSGINPVNTTMIFSIKLFYPKQMFPGNVSPLLPCFLCSFVFLTCIQGNTWKRYGQKEMGWLEKEFDFFLLLWLLC